MIVKATNESAGAAINAMVTTANQNSLAGGASESEFEEEDDELSP